MRDKEHIIVWVDYYDREISRRGGRRVSKKLSVEDPKIEDVLKATKRAGFSPTSEKEKAFPRFWWKMRGRVIVKRKYSKTKTLRVIGEKLKK